MIEGMRPIESMTSLVGLLRARHVLFISNSDEEALIIVKDKLKKKLHGSITQYRLSDILDIASERKIKPEQVVNDNLTLILSEEGDTPIFFLEPNVIGTETTTFFLQALSSLQPSRQNKTHGAIVIVTERQQNEINTDSLKEIICYKTF